MRIWFRKLAGTRDWQYLRILATSVSGGEGTHPRHPDRAVAEQQPEHPVADHRSACHDREVLLFPILDLRMVHKETNEGYNSNHVYRRDACAVVRSQGAPV